MFLHMNLTGHFLQGASSGGESDGNRAINQKVAGSIPGHANDVVFFTLLASGGE